MYYIIALVALIAIYICAILLMKRMTNQPLCNALFAATVFIPYVIMVIRVYLSVGFYDWNFQNALPVANVSPFMFTMVPLIFLLPRRLRKHPQLLVSLLSVGMFLSTVLACIYNARIGYKFHFHFLLDYIAHFSLSLWGIYLVRSKQVSLTRKSCLVSGSIIIASATLMLVLNLIFDTSFFGLSLRGQHNIYNTVLVENSYLSALLYYLGLTGVLLMGYVFQKILNRNQNQN